MKINNNTVYFSKVREGAVIPTKRNEDAGFDIYPCFNEKHIIIRPHETKIINAGIKSAFPAYLAAILFERGSTGTKGIGQRAGVIDSNYRGEWMIPITNHNNKPLVIKKDECEYPFDDEFIVYPYNKAITQAIFHIVPDLNVIETTNDVIDSFASERGEGKLGSSGK